MPESKQNWEDYRKELEELDDAYNAYRRDVLTPEDIKILKILFTVLTELDPKDKKALAEIATRMLNISKISGAEKYIEEGRNQEIESITDNLTSFLQRYLPNEGTENPDAN